MEKTFENGNPVGFVILERDAAELHLTLSKTHRATDRNLAHLLVSDATKLTATGSTSASESRGRRATNSRNSFAPRPTGSHARRPKNRIPRAADR